MTTDLRIAITCIFAGFFFVGLAPPESGTASAAQAMTAHGVYHGFNEAVARHVALHAELASEASDAMATSAALGLLNASDRLAAAIRAARPRAHQGAFFDGPAAAAIQRAIREELRPPSTSMALSSSDDARPPFRHPRIYVPFPASSEMAPMPHSLLQLLPALPDILEYRIVGEYLVLRDVKAALVLDYIPGAFSRSDR